MLNHITIMGRLTRDPELRRTGSGVAVASFTVAVDRDFGGRDGGEKETDFIDCVAWRQTGEFVSKYFTKGSMIVVSGRLQIRGWTDKDGNKRRSAEVLQKTATSARASGAPTAVPPTVATPTAATATLLPRPATAATPPPPLLLHPISRCWMTTTHSFLSN